MLNMRKGHRMFTRLKLITKLTTFTYQSQILNETFVREKMNKMVNERFALKRAHAHLRAKN
jgi:hypothetical protein